MLIESTVQGMQWRADRLRASGRTTALVPTMGALHEGHLQLVDAARREADHVTVSIFVNPTQFGPGEDYQAYPRDLGADARRVQERGADVVFAPSVEEMYVGEPAAWVSVERLGDHLCGASRPGHFRGVATVVTKLLLACRPDVAVFGLKDAQQFFVLKRLVRELMFGVRLVGVPIVREADGLAMSSRNRYLEGEDRAAAVVLSRAVRAARACIEEGEREASGVIARMRDELGSHDRVRIDYAEVVDTVDLQPVERLESGSTVLAAVAAFVGPARLIDNAIVDVP